MPTTVDGAVTASEGQADPQLWYAAKSGTDFRRHRLPSEKRTGDWNSVVALCGDARKEWWPVDQFVDPSAFRPCRACASAAEDPA
jgi:hypothetical protein